LFGPHRYCEDLARAEPVDRAGGNYPLARLTGRGRDAVKVGVIGTRSEIAALGPGGYTGWSSRPPAI
jgi:hypothetical protein